MNIRNKLSVQFTLIVATILLFLTTGVYFLSSNYRQSEFNSRLEEKANTTARLLLKVEEVSEDILKVIDKNTVTLFDEKIFIYDNKNELIYFKSVDPIPTLDLGLINKIRTDRILKFKNKKNEALGIVYRANNIDYIVIISAYDIYGFSKMNNLEFVLIFGFFAGLIISIILGVIFSGKALAPISRVIFQVQNITGSNLNERVDEGNQKDEIAQLAMTFNQMLQRIEDAFILQNDFVSNAAHELRTPFAILLAEADFTLMQERDNDHYKKVIQSQSTELKKLSTLSNGLLDLARMSFDKSTFQKQTIRVDELLVETCNLVISSNSNYNIHINFDSLPENSDLLSIMGNEQLLTIAFKNLIENACKFSNSKAVQISLIPAEKNIIVNFTDDGIGILKEDIYNIFQPFFRGKNVHFITGYGIGLALTQKIIQLHNSQITVESEPGNGSTFSVIIPIIQTF